MFLVAQEYGEDFLTWEDGHTTDDGMNHVHFHMASGRACDSPA